MNILEAWFEQFRDKPIAVSEIGRNPTTEIYRVLLNKDGAWSPEWVGYRLGRLRNRIEGGKKLVRIGESARSSSRRLWRVVEVGAAPEVQEEASHAKTSLF